MDSKTWVELQKKGRVVGNHAGLYCHMLKNTTSFKEFSVLSPKFSAPASLNVYFIACACIAQTFFRGVYFTVLFPNGLPIPRKNKLHQFFVVAGCCLI